MKEKNMRSISSLRLVNLLLITLFLLSSNAAIILDMPFYRQILGFIYVSFLPGFLLCRILNIRLDKWEILIYSLGLSIFFTIATGGIINFIFPFFGISEPLSTFTLLITYDTLICGLLSFLIYTKKYLNILSFTHVFQIKNEQYLSFLLVLSSLPPLTFFGTKFLDATGNGLINFLILISIVVCFFLIISKSYFTDLFPFALLMFTLSLLLMVSMRSNYLVGYDIHEEYHVFQLARYGFRWNYEYFIHPFNSSLSITILPTIYFSLLNVSGELIFKLVYPIILSFVPVSLYYTFKQKIGHLDAFLSPLFIMSSQYFYYWMPTLAKQEISYLFFALFLHVLFEKRISSISKKFLMILICVGIILSHYATSSVTLLILIGGYCTSLLLQHEVRERKRNITLMFVILFFVIAFVWNSMITSSVVHEVLVRAKYAWEYTVSIGLIEESFAVQLTSGQRSIPTLTGRLRYIAGIIPSFLILIGAIHLMVHRRRNPLGSEYLCILLSAFLWLGFGIFSNSLGAGYAIQRFYIQSLLVLAPLCVAGGKVLLNAFKSILTRTTSSKFDPTLRSYVLVIIVLLMLFSTNTGVVSYLTNEEPIEFTISNKGVDYKAIYVRDQDYAAASWLGHLHPREVYAEGFSDRVVRSYVMSLSAKTYFSTGNRTYLEYPHTYLIKPDTEKIPRNAYLYLRSDWMFLFEALERNPILVNTTSMSHLYSSKCRIYNNGVAVIYYG